MSTVRWRFGAGHAHERGRVFMLAAVLGGGLFFAALAVAYDVRQKTTTELAIAAVVTALVCAIVADPRKFLLVVVAFDLPLQWGKYLHWDPKLASVGEIPGFQVSLTTLALAALYLLWALGRGGTRGRRPILWPAAPLIVYVALNVASGFVASNP